MNKKGGISFILLFFSIFLFSQDRKSFFDSVEKDFSTERSSFGYVPAPGKRYYKQADVAFKSQEVLPSRYDLRNNALPEARNQNPAGTCWAFTSLDVIQSYWIQLSRNEGLLSPENMANCHGFDRKKNDGGNAYMSIAYLSRLDGPVYENSNPYVASISGTCKAVSQQDIPAYNLGLYDINTSSIEECKRLILEHGSLYASIYYDSRFLKNEDYSYCYNGIEATNHSVTIVGWDDNKTTLANKKPGVWILKNSWGTSWGDNGYFYASYEDSYVGKNVFVFHDRIEKNEIDAIYFYDKLGYTRNFGFIDKTSEFNVNYALIKFNTPSRQQLNKIGTYAIAGGSTISFQIYSEKRENELIGLIAEKELYCPYPGYYTVNIPAIVDGDFYIKVKYYSNLTPYNIPTEHFIFDYADPQLKETGLQWISRYGDIWEDVGNVSDTERQFNLCIKAYTKHVVDNVFFRKQDDNPIGCIGEEIFFENLTTEDFDSYEWNFGNNAIPPTFSTSEKETVSTTYSTSGLKNVTLSGIKNNVPYSFTIERMIDIRENFNINIISSNNKEIIPPNHRITLNATGGSNYKWTATNEYPETFKDYVTFKTPASAGDYTYSVEASSISCYDSESITLTIQTVPYDNIADAYALTLDKIEGPFSNEFASVEDNEPCPPIGDCNTQHSWCEERGLQNSLWLKFTAPEIPITKIDTRGFDNQIALYDAIETGTYADIMSGEPAKYAILAANDDYHVDDFSGCITEIPPLQPGKTYWIQLDGSGGGDIGEATVIVKTSLETQQENTYISQGANYVKIYGNSPIESVRLYNIAGQSIKSAYSINAYEYDINTENIDTGIYIIIISTTEELITKKIIIK